MKTPITKTFLAMCLLAVHSSFGQSKCDCFDRLYALSKYYDRAENGEMAISAMVDALSYLDKAARPAYYGELGELFAFYKIPDSAVKYYTLAIKEGGYDIEAVKENYPELYGRLAKQKLKNLKLREEPNLFFYRKFTSALAVDQIIRSDEALASAVYDKKDSFTAIRKEIYDRLVYDVDSTTFTFVKWVLDTIGFPSYTKLGFVPEGFVAELLHITAYGKSDWDNYLYPKLTALNALGDYALKSQILFFKDRQSTYNGRKTLTGAFGERNRYGDIVNIKAADSIRFQYNLLRIKDEAPSYPSSTVPAAYSAGRYPNNYFCLKKYGLD